MREFVLSILINILEGSNENKSKRKIIEKNNQKKD